MPPASPSSVFLVPTKNLSREQGVPRQHAISAQQPIHLSMRCTCFGWVSDIACCRGTPCSRERFFVGTRKTDDGDRPRGARGTERSPAVLCHRRGGLTKYPAEKIRGTAGVVRQLCGLAGTDLHGARFSAQGRGFNFRGVRDDEDLLVTAGLSPSGIRVTAKNLIWRRSPGRPVGPETRSSTLSVQTPLASLPANSPLPKMALIGCWDMPVRLCRRADVPSGPISVSLSCSGSG